MKKIKLILLGILSISILTSCGALENPPTDNSELEDGVSAIEDAMNAGNSDDTGKNTENMEDWQEGTSENTVATPDDFPEAYDYGTGQIRDYSRMAMLKKMPEPEKNQTVLNTEADPTKIQVLYLWEKDNVPAVTKFTEDMTGYFDNWDFRPYVTAIPVEKGVEPKGAVVLMAGGAYQFRGN